MFLYLKYLFNYLYNWYLNTLSFITILLFFHTQSIPSYNFFLIISVCVSLIDACNEYFQPLSIFTDLYNEISWYISQNNVVQIFKQNWLITCFIISNKYDTICCWKYDYTWKFQIQILFFNFQIEISVRVPSFTFFFWRPLNTIDSLFNPLGSL